MFEGVESIGDYAFSHSYFSTGKFASSIRQIGAHAFEGCTFSYCDVLFDCKELEIGDYAFSGVTIHKGSGLPYYSIGITGVSKIGSFAFDVTSEDTFGFKQKATVTIDLTGVTSVGQRAFAGQTVSVNGYVNLWGYLIGDNAYYDQGGRLYPNIWPATAKTIPDSCFRSSTVESLTVEDGVLEIGNGAFANSSLREIELPPTLTAIGDNAFKGCSSLMEVAIPASVTRIGSDAFDRSSIRLIVEQDSYAALWAMENGYNFTYPDSGNDDLDWLNN